MARTQAADYELRRRAIADAAARIFAERGFAGASVVDLAAAAQISKPLLYHYFRSKQDVLFFTMESHVQQLLATVTEIHSQPISPEQRFRAITHSLIALYVGAETRHRVLLNELKWLSTKQRKAIVGIQRELITMIGSLIGELRPSLGKNSSILNRPAAMLYFGMINWTYTWLDPAGPAPPTSIADLAGEIFLRGLIS